MSSRLEAMAEREERVSTREANAQRREEQLAAMDHVFEQQRKKQEVNGAIRLSVVGQHTVHLTQYLSCVSLWLFMQALEVLKGEADAAMAKLQIERQALEERLKLAEERERRAEQRISTANDKEEALNELVAKREAMLARMDKAAKEKEEVLAENIRRLEQELTGLDARRAEKEQAVRLIEKEREEARQRYEHKVEEHQQSWDSLQKSFTLLREEFDFKQRELEDVHDECAEKERRSKEADRNVLAKRKELAELNGKMRNARSDCDRLMGCIGDLRGELKREKQKQTAEWMDLQRQLELLGERAKDDVRQKYLGASEELRIGREAFAREKDEVAKDLRKLHESKKAWEAHVTSVREHLETERSALQEHIQKEKAALSKVSNGRYLNEMIW